MESERIQEIFDCAIGYLPSGWKRAAFYFSFVGSMMSHIFYVDTGKGYVDCFRMGYRKEDLRQVFFLIKDILSQERNSLPNDKVWNVFSLIVSSDGTFEAEYCYDDISETFVEHHQQWEKQLVAQ